MSLKKKELLKERGKQALQYLLREAGGTCSAQEAAERLQIGQESLSHQIDSKQVLAVFVDGEMRFPVCQFDGNSVLDHFADIYRLLDTASPVSAIRFFLTHDGDLGDTPQNALKDATPERLEVIRILAKQFNQQVAR